MSEQNDTIYRQVAIDAVETKIKKWNAVDGEGYHVGLGLRYTDVIDMLTELPPAEPQRMKGRWIVIQGMNEQCSKCGKFFPLSYFKDRPFEINYCPNCGADMRGDENERPD